MYATSEVNMKICALEPFKFKNQVASLCNEAFPELKLHTV